MVQNSRVFITRSIGNLLTGKSLAAELVAAILLAVKLLVTSSGTLTGSGLFVSLSSVFAPNFRQISSIPVQTLDTNLVASRRIEGEEASLPVNLCRSKTSLLKTSNANVELMPLFTGIKENIQLFRERLSEKVHATMPKGIVGGFDFTVLQRNLREWH